MARAGYIWVVLEDCGYGDARFHSAFTVRHKMVERFVRWPLTLPTDFIVLRVQDGEYDHVNSKQENVTVHIHEAIQALRTKERKL